MLLVAATAATLAGCTGGAGQRAGAAGAGVSVAVPAAAPAVAPAPVEAPLPRPLTDRFAAVLTRAVGEEGLPGLTAAVVTAHGSWAGAVGHDGAGTALVAADSMAVGSVSKTFTAAEVLHLVATGRIGLDDPLRRVVPSRLTAGGVTVRQALEMLSGLGDGNYLPRLEQALPPDVHVGLAQALALDTETPGVPGRQRAYSNVGFLLLAAAVQKVTGRPFADAVHRDLLAPNHLTSVAVQDRDRPRPPLAYPADVNGDPPLRDGFLPDRAMASGALGAGSMTSDAADLARWGYLLYGGRVLPTVLTRQLTAVRPAPGFRYGLGTEIFDPEVIGFGEPAVGHEGLIFRLVDGTTHDGYAAMLVAVPSRGVSVAVLVPQTDKDYHPAMTRLLAAALG